MSTHTIDTRTRVGWPLFAVLGVGIALVLAAIGTWVAGSDSGSDQGMKDYLITVAMIAVEAGLIYGLVARTESATRSLVLGILSVVSIPVFWSGLPPLLASGAMACAFGSSDLTTKAKVGTGLAAVATVLACIIAFVG